MCWLAIEQRKWSKTLTPNSSLLTPNLFEDPPETLELRVGDWSVAVTNAGEYVFLLGKGVRYDLDIFPNTLTAVEFSAVDDVGRNRTALASSHRGENDGHWTEDHGGLEIVISNPMVPLAPSASFVFWSPTLSVSPWNWQPSELNPEETFAAILSDIPWFSSPSYEWRTEDAQVVSVDSPRSVSTRMQCHFPKAYSNRPELSLEVSLAGCTLHSYYSFGCDDGDSGSIVRLDFTLPDVVFINNDDDDDDGNSDDEVSVGLGDDDVAYGQLKLHSPNETNGTVVIESILGYDSGFSDHGLMFSDAACTQEIEEGTEYPVENVRFWSLPMHFNAANVSGSHPGVQIKARWRPSVGPDIVASGYMTVVMPVVEPICNEMTNVVVGGVTRNLVYNPCGVGIGREAYFKIDVQPAEFPDEMIVWSADGGLEFVGGNTGRSVKVRGTERGSARLRVFIREDDYEPPEFQVYVTPCTNIPIHAVVVCNEGLSAQSTDRINAMISVANDIYAQVGMSFYLASICMTNIPAAYKITKEDENNGVWCHDRLTAILHDTGGVECYFVGEVVDADGNALDIDGMASRAGIVVARDAFDTTLAHEIGHLCGALDIYESNKSGALTLDGIGVRCSNMRSDWNGGCDGRGSAGARYYRYGMGMAEIISRMLMNGRTGDADQHYDITLGSVYGIRKITQDEYQKDHVDVGFKGDSGFNIPYCE